MNCLNILIHGQIFTIAQGVGSFGSLALVDTAVAVAVEGHETLVVAAGAGESLASGSVPDQEDLEAGQKEELTKVA